ncbi:hypothetical protein F441_10875 [Phytophthora nicotianae CJ01A1]|uniref:Uncharacterized protein n=2 Tax=Phytophthora nicotianae TaxID=4792 RepID=W2GPU5_PHYNI|nr:hypothetical protein L915_10696 [Phytophthora nicotianae]ETL37770.1 hypothetical protein L916_10587 [Phytophthora nicotianae]ETP14159.1 hypothetical protein F441_10875 [Phytophthora nicotianae CJ01A1]
MNCASAVLLNGVLGSPQSAKSALNQSNLWRLRSNSARVRDAHLRFRPPPPNLPNARLQDQGTKRRKPQEQHLTRDFDELIAVVEAAYWELPPSTINAAFLSLQTTMNKCIEEKGVNDFKPIQMGKAHLAKEGRLPLSIRCSSTAAEVLSLS